MRGSVCNMKNNPIDCRPSQIDSLFQCPNDIFRNANVIWALSLCPGNNCLEGFFLIFDPRFMEKVKICN